MHRNKSDISYLKTSRTFDVPIHSSQTLLISDSVGTTSSYASGVSALGQLRIYIASASWYPSRSPNCGRLLIAATQSSRLNCRSRVAWRHGNNVRDVIIAHVISVDAHTYIHIYRRRNCKVILGPAGRAAGW